MVGYRLCGHVQRHELTDMGMNMCMNTCVDTSMGMHMGMCMASWLDVCVCGLEYRLMEHTMWSQESASQSGQAGNLRWLPS